MNVEAANIEFCRRQYERNESLSHIIAIAHRFSSKGKTARSLRYNFLFNDGPQIDSPYSDTVQQAKLKAGSKPATISPPHPQTLEHIR